MRRLCGWRCCGWSGGGLGVEWRAVLWVARRVVSLRRAAPFFGDHTLARVKGDSCASLTSRSPTKDRIPPRNTNNSISDCRRVFPLSHPDVKGPDPMRIIAVTTLTAPNPPPAVLARPHPYSPRLGSY